MYRSVGPVRYRITTDVGGTFTDIVVVDVKTGEMVLGKAPSTPERPIEGVRNALDNAAEGAGITTEDLLRGCEYIIYSTTRATNAVLERTTARTALVVTEGFPDILTLRDGGKLRPFELKVDFPSPYVPRHLTIEARERIDAEGGIVTPLEAARSRRGPLRGQPHRGDEPRRDRRVRSGIRVLRDARASYSQKLVAAAGLELPATSVDSH